MYDYKVIRSDRSNYGVCRTAKSIKYIVIHYTANDGDCAENNGKYFSGVNRNASAHYFVDDNTVVESVSPNNVAWSVGGSKYSNCSSTGGGKYYGKCVNSNSINVEMCDTIKNGLHDASKATLNNTILLVKKLMKQYNIPLSNVIRHFDITGKSCPAFFCGSDKNDKAWEEFKNELIKDEIPSNFVNKDSDKNTIVWMQDKLNKIPVKTEKLVVDGIWGKKTTEYIKLVCKKLKWTPYKNGEEIRSRFIKKLKEV